MKFFAKVKDIIIKILTKISCKSSCLNDSHDVTIKFEGELHEIRHDLKNTLQGMSYLIDSILDDPEEKLLHREQLNKTVVMINDKINTEYINKIKTEHSP